MRPALFLDRDGIVNRRIVGGYVATPSEFELLVDVLPILRNARKAGCLLILITNQQGVGKGLMTLADLEKVHQYMQNLLARHLGFAFDAIYVCTSLASAGDPRRKPQPGMLLEAITEHQIEPTTSWFIGDSVTDAQAGRAAGVGTILVGDHPADAADAVFPTLRDLKIPTSID